MAAVAVTPGDKYDLGKTRILLTGTQAVVRLALMQRARDLRQGKRTAGYVTGYRGSPLGGLDQQFWRAKDVLAPAEIVFQAGLNEDIAATALWGTQQAEMRGEGRYDGVFGIWYGKGPGVDRSGDALKHANLAGTSPWGGVLALMGDDHTCESSTTAHQSEFAFVDAMIPVLSPAGVQEILDYGLFGFALSRFAGTWVGLKCVKDTVESTATVDGSLNRVATMIPGGFRMPAGGLNIRPRDAPLAQEERLHEHKLAAVHAFLRANSQDRTVLAGGWRPRLGIVTAGKSYLDVLQALDDLGIDEVRAADLGLRLLKIACTWPIEPETIRTFAKGLETILVVEEKRGLIEGQVKEILYPEAARPVVIGKRDEAGDWLFRSRGMLDPNQIAVVIGKRLVDGHQDDRLSRRLAEVSRAQDALAEGRDLASRTPYFCAGCPYNSGTVVPEGSRAYAGIGCHYLVQPMGRSTEGYTQMGAEGANWIGEAPFSTRNHIFQNVGDGTYNHSGSLVIRAAVISGINMTFKILFNDAVALTGGQPVDGNPTVPMIAEQVAAEGVGRVVIVTDDPERYPTGTTLPFGTTVSHRDDIDAVQKELARVGGVSVMIYDQTCAAEKRRRRKRGTFPDPDRRVVINELVCEGCGDCGVQSNCVAIVPVETEFGRKRAIDQSTCNKDFSCIKGFCPSFVTVHGGKLRKGEMVAEAMDLPEPQIPAINGNFAILITGVGGTGVITIGALLATAAHLDGKAAATIDMSGLAQKGGAVTSHVRIAAEPDRINAIRIAAGGADLVLGCDMVVASSARSLAAIDPGRTRAIVNTHEIYPGEFTQDADFTLPTRRIVQAITARLGADQSRFLEATRIATALMGDAIATNVFMLGVAFQAGAIPLSRTAIERAIEVNGVDVAMNQAAFAWGRRAALEPDAVAAIAERHTSRPAAPEKQSLDELVARRAKFLTAYQDEVYAQRYVDWVGRIREAEAAVSTGRADLAETVARNLFRLMAVKDEYEVARLYTDGSFRRQLAREFSGWERLEFHLAPPILAKRDPATGHLTKASFGPWMMRTFGRLASMRRIRGTIFDPFSYSAERRMERRLRADYENTLATILEHLSPANHDLAVGLAGYPEKIRGFGHVKAEAARRVAGDAEARRDAFLGGRVRAEAAE
jgi:indolepyruvate ferredoxin oxidoreductase